MPGIFGSVGCDREVPHLLHALFENRWGACEFLSGEWGGVGAHAFSGQALTQSQTLVVAVDGELSVYTSRDGEEAPLVAPFPESPDSTEPRLKKSHRGNTAVLNTSARTLILAVEASGSFPLYFGFTRSGGFAFSSNLEVLSRALGQELDPIGALEYLRNGYTLMGRTYYSKIRRLQPGQVLSFSLGRGSHVVTEQSEAWNGSGRIDRRGSNAFERRDLWGLLTASVEEGIAGSTAPALMLSAGWDSRTLLAAALSATPRPELLAYTHGDSQSRELSLARRLAAAGGVPFMEREIDGRIYDVDRLQKGFRRVGSVEFPHWHAAGENLLAAGRDSVMAGVFGEVLGGHYGPAMAAQGSRRITLTLLQILGRGFAGAMSTSSLLAEARKLIQRPLSGKPWYLSADFWSSLEAPQAAIESDLEDALSRLHERGIKDLESLVEAFLAEHRGTQLINMQLLSCRAHLDVVMPFAHSELVRQATQLDLGERVQNKANQRLLAQHASELLRHPCAATLVPASWPILLQELSRGVRRYWEHAWWDLHFRSGGIIREPRLGWLNLQFLTHSTALAPIVEDLREPIWDHAAIRQTVGSVRSGEWKQSAHSLVDQLMKIYTVELSLRTSD